MKTELLAPAKDKITAIEAINSGADAVYIGANSFGARQNAGNSIEDIAEVVQYAHKFWAKVFVTVNTILTDFELDSAVELIKSLDSIGVDAIIIQDMGLLKKLIDLQPQLKIPLHASTQCDNRSIQKIEFFNKIGLPRVVLARELSLEQIAQIHRENPNIELEVFIHGALCVSYSGQCYLSQFIGGRSANRGVCAQPCRKKYSLLNDKGDYLIKNKPLLCLKDFNASQHVKELIDAGVFSFKIEGRLKDINYVKNVVAFYRQELDKYSEKISSGKSTYSFVPDLDKTFNRGFTDYFLDGRTDCYNLISPKSMGKYIGNAINVTNNYIDIKTNADIFPQDGLCYIINDNLKGFLVNKVEKIGGKVRIYPNKKIDISLGVKLYRNFDIMFEKQLSYDVKRQIEVEVLVSNNVVQLIDEDGITISLSVPSGEPAKNQQKMNVTFITQFSKCGESDFNIKKINLCSDLPFLPISVINQLRRNAFEKLIQERLKSYKRECQKTLKITNYYKNEVDYRANIHNDMAKKFYEETGVNVKECSFELNPPLRQVELMRTKHCIKYALGMCKSSQKLILEDEKGTHYPLLFDCKNCEMAVLSPKMH